jgi:AcrR family transcriptional regulator
VVSSSDDVRETSPPPARRRKDAERTRELLIDAVGDLVAEFGQAFGVPDIARRAGVAAPTAYRHFKDVPTAVEAFQNRLIRQLCAALASASASGDAVERLNAVNEVWVEEAERWGPAAVRIRPWRSVTSRLSSGNPRTQELSAAVMPVARALVDEGHVPDQSLDYIMLMWLTLLDERLILELRQEFKWTRSRVARQLSEALLALLRAPESRQRTRG